MKKSQTKIDPALSITGADLVDKIVVVRESFADPLRLFHAMGGFGTNPAAMGRAVNGRWLSEPKDRHDRIDRGDIVRFATTEEVEEGLKYMDLPADERFKRQHAAFHEQVRISMAEIREGTRSVDKLMNAYDLLARRYEYMANLVEQNLDYIAKEVQPK